MPIRVLIVDDQEPFQHAARAVVDATDGFIAVGVVATGEASVETVDALRPDLVLMDVNLPGIDGLEATRRILGVEGLNRIVVLLLSAYEEEEHAANIFDCGAAGYIAKSAFRPRAPGRRLDGRQDRLIDGRGRRWLEGDATLHAAGTGAHQQGPAECLHPIDHELQAGVLSGLRL